MSITILRMISSVGTLVCVVGAALAAFMITGTEPRSTTLCICCAGSLAGCVGSVVLTGGPSWPGCVRWGDLPKRISVVAVILRVMFLAMGVGLALGYEYEEIHRYSADAVVMALAAVIGAAWFAGHLVRRYWSAPSAGPTVTA